MVSSGSGDCSRAFGTGYLIVSVGVVRGTGLEGGFDPLRLSQARTSETLETRGSALGFRDCVYWSRCHKMPSSSSQVSVPTMRQSPRDLSENE